MTHIGLAAFVLAGASLLLGACGSDDSLGGQPSTVNTGGQPGGAPTEGGSATSGCEQGATRPCLGPGACQGAQMCQSDRTWSTCDCGAPASGGAPPSGTGGMGPAAGGTPSTGGIGPDLGGTPSTGGAIGLAGCQSYANFPANCGGVVSMASLRRVNTLLVVDKSGSMNDQPAGYAQNKWASLTGALSTVATNLESRMAFGLEMFPGKAVGATCTTECCDMLATGTIDVPIPGAVADINGVLAQTVAGGGTPTAQALRSALSYFTTGAGSALGGKKVVFLATDGGPNCNASISGGCAAEACTYNIDGRPAACTPTFNCCDPANAGQAVGCLDTAAVVTAIHALSSAGIPTVVLGLPGTEAYATVLDQMAQAGSVPNPNAPPSYYAANAADGVQGLINAINQVMTQLINRCEVQLDQSLPDPTQVDVAVDCTVLSRPSSDGGAAEWYLNLGTNPPTVVLQGAACDYVETQGAERVDVILGCSGG